MSSASFLADRFAAGFPTERSWRTVGREAELPLVHPDGTTADLRALWPLLGEEGGTFGYEGTIPVSLTGPGYTLAAEVGLGTIEIITDPCEDLHQVRDTMERARDQVLRACARAGVQLLGYGIQPVSPPSEAVQTPKQRYGVLLEALGPSWLWFTLTASDQTHVAIARDEIVPFTNLGNLLAPVTIALCANSPIHSGSDGGLCSAREGQMGTILSDSTRHGMSAGPVADLASHVQRMLDMRFLFEKIDGVPTLFADTFATWLDRAGGPEAPGAFEGFLLQDHYIWNSARPRLHGTLELRAACQQPHDSHMAAAALHVGLVCAAGPLARFVDDTLGPDAWPTLSAWHRAVVREGLAAPEPVPGFLATVLDHCEVALVARGRGEEVYLEPLRARLSDGRNPAQVARDVFAAEGMSGLLAHTGA